MEEEVAVKAAAVVARWWWARWWRPRRWWPSKEAAGQAAVKAGGQAKRRRAGRRRNSRPIIESPFPNDPFGLAAILPEFLDYVTVNKAPTIPGRININQASPVILRGIPGMTEEIVQRILAERELEYTGNKPAHRHEHWILCEGIVTLDEMKRMVPFITARGRVFRAQVVGYFDEEGPSSRVEAVVNAATFGGWFGHPPRSILEGPDEFGPRIQPGDAGDRGTMSESYE